MEYTIVPLTKDILPALVHLEETCFQTPWTEKMFEGELQNPLTEYRIILHKGLPVAYMGMWCVGDEGQITNLCTSPKHRGKGFGKKLIQAMIDIGMEKGLTCLTLEVRKSNEPAIGLYTAMGFVPVGTRKNYYEGKEDALLMTLFLKKTPQRKGEVL